MSLLKPPDIARGRASSFPAIAIVPSDRVWTHLALVVVQLAFAAGAVEGKLALNPAEVGGAGIDPVALAMARMAGGALFFQGFARTSGRLGPVGSSDQRRMAGLAVLGVVLNQTLFLVGLRFTSAFAAALLGATIPVFAAALAVVFRIERAGFRTALGLALAISGVLWLTGIGSVDYGAIAIALNCLSYALFIVLSKRVIERHGSLTTVAWIFTWGALIMAPFGCWPLLKGMASWSPQAWGFVAFFVAGPTVVAYLLNAWALGRSSPTLVSVYIYLQPVFAALLQWVQLGAPVGGRAIGATGLILAGLGVVATRPAFREAARR
jgi:drug/metabolite transporter (DMT)-like permease